ncbi:MAG: transposase, partial [Candidatus Krumholzibacteriota bacterium]
MPKPRQSLISLEATPYYHCISRCVRRAYLCGEDALTGRSFEHRRGWIEQRLLELSRTFAMEICAYAILSNHSHIVIYVDREMAHSWTLSEVIERWHALFSGITLSQRYLQGVGLCEAEMRKLEEVVETWRERLMSVSWFMRCLNEHIARLANAEDGCTGRFWEGRFKSQALLDESALAACLAYVDLNPIRAGMADTPEGSDYTSIQRRINDLKSSTVDKGTTDEAPARELFPFVGNPRQEMPKGLPFALMDYLELVDWTGRIVREDKRGSMSVDTPPILQRLKIEPDAWLQLTTRFEEDFCNLVGRPDSLPGACAALGL